MKKYSFFVILLLFSFKANVTAQIAIDKDNIMNYLNHNKNLDPIEGIWTLNVDRTLYLRKDSIAHETEFNRSEWAVIKNKDGKYSVMNIGGAENEDGATDFNAYFEETSEKDIYSYICKFIKPRWVAKSKAKLTDNVILQYGYFSSKAYMKDAYKEKYVKGLKIYWLFTWTKRYPIENAQKI